MWLVLKNFVGLSKKANMMYVSNSNKFYEVISVSAYQIFVLFFIYLLIFRMLYTLRKCKSKMGRKFSISSEYKYFKKFFRSNFNKFTVILNFI